MDDGPAAALDVVDQDVEASEALDHGLCHEGDVLGLPQVRLKDEMLPAGGGQVASEVSQFFLPVEISYRNCGAGLRQSQRDGLADALDAAEDERRSSIKIHESPPSSRLNAAATPEEKSQTANRRVGLTCSPRIIRQETAGSRGSGGSGFQPR